MPVISVPSNILKKNNLEILVTSFAALTSQPNGPITSPTSLLPTIDVPASTSGRHTLVDYPVHKSLSIVSLQDLVKRTVPDSAGKPRSPDLVQSVLLAVGETNNLSDNELHDIGLMGRVDPSKAENGLKAIRKSLENAMVFEHDWNNSGVPQVTKFITARGQAGSQGLNSVVRALIESLLSDATESIEARQLESDRMLLNVGDASVKTKLALNDAIAAWALRAHTELRDTLKKTFSSNSWQRLTWWSLYWRVDDVTMILTELLEKGWLPGAQNETLFLAGRLQQAGLLMGRPETMPAEPPKSAQPGNEDISTVEEPMLHTQIEHFRDNLASLTIPPMQALAQRLVLTSLSVTGLTSGLSALLYVSFSGSIYDSATIAALGLVFSLRHVQKNWGTACIFWEREVREEGRKALKNTEVAMRSGLVVENGAVADPIEISMRKDAADSVEKAKQALKKLPRS